MSNLEIYNQTFSETFSTIEIDDIELLKYQSVKAWDSIGHLMLIANIEQAFLISMEMDDIINFSSYQKGIEILKNYDVEI